MTRKELLKRWCAAEGGKKSALDAPQSREAYAKLRKIVMCENGIDLDDVIQDKVVCTSYHGGFVAVSYKWRAVNAELLTGPSRKPTTKRRVAK